MTNSIANGDDDLENLKKQIYKLKPHEKKEIADYLAKEVCDGKEVHAIKVDGQPNVGIYKPVTEIN